MLKALDKLLDLILGEKVEERVFALDIGSGAIKLLELEFQADGTPCLLNLGLVPTPGEALQNNLVAKSEAVAEAIRKLVAAQGVEARQVVFGLPGPSAFTKKISLPKQSRAELIENIGFEAVNYIPHRIEDVKLDFQVLGESVTQLEVLLVAVKADIVNTFESAVLGAGLEPVIADIDFFALENAFQLNHPEEQDKTVAIVDLGARYSNIHILQDGHSLFTGDVSLGGRLVTDKIAELLEINRAEAEQIKLELREASDNVRAALAGGIEHLAGELERQLGFFWSAAATDRQLEAIFLCGGSSSLPGLCETLEKKTGIRVQQLETFRHVKISDSVDQELVKELAPSMTVALGLALRRLGDKPWPAGLGDSTGQAGAA